MAAAAVQRYYGNERVVTLLAANGESDSIIQGIKLSNSSEPDEIWITDLSWTSIATAAHLTNLTREGARVFWIDHHRTAVSRADAPEFDVPYAARVLSEEYSAARLTFNFLQKTAHESGDERRLHAFDTFQQFAAIADDHDRWIHKIPESADWALAVQTLGGMESYREIIRMREPMLSRRLRLALENGRNAMDRSLQVAQATMVERPLGNGLRLRSACCVGYSSEVASKLYEGQQRTVIALFDLRSLGVSLRRSADCDVDLSELARNFGGGGHAAAAGFAVSDVKRAPAERLVEILAERLENDSRGA
jgi:oligoribonuclease NrnB/cAMP/cGMP phosphodiesterase (DHH superfamily)